MGQSNQDILGAANLAKLELTAAKTDEYAGQLTAVLRYVEELQSVMEAEQVKDENIGQITGLTNQLAADEIKNCEVPQDKLLANAPVQERGYVKVKSIFGRAT